MVFKKIDGMKLIIRITFLWIFLLGFNNIIFSQSKNTVFLIGDSTMSDKKDPDKNPERGWGQVLSEFLPANITVDNHAVNGRSTRSFIEEGKWEVVLKNIKKGDFVFIQFGHNDQKVKDPKRYTNPFTAYRNNLIRYVEESRTAGATPVLFTSIVRRKFNKHGTLVDTHGDYPLVVRMVANDFKVSLVDLQNLTEKMEISHGVEGSKKLHLHFQPNENPYFPEGKKDNTHLSLLGAKTIAKMAAKELTKLNLLTPSSNSPTDAKIAEILDNIQLPVIPDYEVKLQRFGGNGDGKTDNKKAFAEAIDHLQKKGGGKLIITKGNYLVNGPIHLIDKMNLHIQKGATIHFGDNPKDYLPMVETSWEGTFLNNYSPLIYANNKSNIAITGEGTINGHADKHWATWKAKEKESKLLSREMNHQSMPIQNRNFGEGQFLRPHLIQLKDCENILVENVHITNSPFWCTHFLRSKSITIKGISFDAHNKNNDGIDLEYAKDVLIEEVDFNNADDNVAIKAGRDHEGRSNSATPSENILVRNCRMKGLHAFVIGSEMAAGVKNVFIQNCQASGYLKRAIYFKTNSDRGGYIKDIYIDNIEVQETEDCIFMTANYHGEGSGLHASKISDIHISNITCKSSSSSGIVVEGYPTLVAEDIHFDQIRIKKAKNALTLVNTKGVTMNEVVIGEQAGTPSSVK